MTLAEVVKLLALLACSVGAEWLCASSPIDRFAGGTEPLLAGGTRGGALPGMPRRIRRRHRAPGPRGACARSRDPLDGARRGGVPGALEAGAAARRRRGRDRGPPAGRVRARRGWEVLADHGVVGHRAKLAPAPRGSRSGTGSGSTASGWWRLRRGASTGSARSGRSSRESDMRAPCGGRSTSERTRGWCGWRKDATRPSGAGSWRAALRRTRNVGGPGWPPADRLRLLRTCRSGGRSNAPRPGSRHLAMRRVGSAIPTVAPPPALDVSARLRGLRMSGASGGGGDRWPVPRATRARAPAPEPQHPPDMLPHRSRRSASRPHRRDLRRFHRASRCAVFSSFIRPGNAGQAQGRATPRMPSIAMPCPVVPSCDMDSDRMVRRGRGGGRRAGWCRPRSRPPGRRSMACETSLSALDIPWT